MSITCRDLTTQEDVQSALLKQSEKCSLIRSVNESTEFNDPMNLLHVSMGGSDGEGVDVPDIKVYR